MLTSRAEPDVSALAVASFFVPDLFRLAELDALALTLAGSVVPVLAVWALLSLLTLALAGVRVLNERRRAREATLTAASLGVPDLWPSANL